MERRDQEREVWRRRWRRDTALLVFGIHVVHTIVNGAVKDEKGEAQKTGKTISAEALGKEYLHLSEQEPSLWTHELDLRPAQRNSELASKMCMQYCWEQEKDSDCI